MTAEYPSQGVGKSTDLRPGDPPSGALQAGEMATDICWYAGCWRAGVSTKQHSKLTLQSKNLGPAPYSGLQFPLMSNHNFPISYPAATRSPVFHQVPHPEYFWEFLRHVGVSHRSIPLVPCHFDQPSETGSVFGRRLLLTSHHQLLKTHHPKNGYGCSPNSPSTGKSPL